MDLPTDICMWIKAWLLNRSQMVFYKGIWLKAETVLSGVPQGSVLGPLLFNLYINGITNGIKSDVLLFADDIKLGRSIKAAEDIIYLQEDLLYLEQWSDEWELKFNIDKCKVMSFGPNNIQY